MVCRTIRSPSIPMKYAFAKVDQILGDLTFSASGRRPLPLPRWIPISQHVFDALGQKLCGTQRLL